MNYTHRCPKCRRHWSHLEIETDRVCEEPETSVCPACEQSNPVWQWNYMDPFIEMVRELHERE